MCVFGECVPFCAFFWSGHFHVFEIVQRQKTWFDFPSVSKTWYHFLTCFGGVPFLHFSNPSISIPMAPHVCWFLYFQLQTMLQTLPRFLARRWHNAAALHGQWTANPPPHPDTGKRRTNFSASPTDILTFRDMDPMDITKSLSLSLSLYIYIYIHKSFRLKNCAWAFLSSLLSILRN